MEELEASAELQHADAARLTAELRDRLMRSHLQSAASVPAAAQQGDFLDVLTSSGAEPGNVFATLLGLLRSAKPSHAYQVKGALTVGDAPDPCGVTIQVVRMPGKASVGKTFWAHDWGEAIARAADHATASILPRTRRCRSPWAGWRGYYLPSSLLYSYERAAELEHGRRYDEALELLYAALQEDPMNPGLRLQIGFLQEGLALYMDALATYEGILSVVHPGRGHSGPGSPARRGRQRPFYCGRERRNRDRFVLVARYRRAILLGGTELPRQWCKAPRDPVTRRDRQREALRERFAPALERVFCRALASDDVEWATRPVYRQAAGGAEPKPTGKLCRPRRRRVLDRLTGTRRRVPRRGSDDPAALLRAAKESPELEELFVLAALHELVELRRQVPGRGRAGDVPLTLAVVDLSGLCVRQRLARVLAELTGAANLDAGAKELGSSIKMIAGRRDFRRWQEHYNAACAYALALEPGGDHELARAAITRLERAVACADSGFVAGRRDWLLSDDPDLDALRATEDFKRFEAVYFPRASKTPKRPAGLHTWELSRYTLDLLSETSGRLAQAWHRRQAQLGTEIEPTALADWCDFERTAWKRVRDVARHHQDWHTRAELIEFAREAGARDEFEAPRVQFSRFAELEAPFADATVGDVSEWVEANDGRLASPADTIDAVDKEVSDCALIGDLALKRARLARIDGNGLSMDRTEVARLCEAHATLWWACANRVTDSGSDERRFPDAMRTLLRRWAELDRRYIEVGPATTSTATAEPTVVVPATPTPARSATEPQLTAAGRDSASVGARVFW